MRVILDGVQSDERRVKAQPDGSDVAIYAEGADGSWYKILTVTERLTARREIVQPAVLAVGWQADEDGRIKLES